MAAGGVGRLWSQQGHAGHGSRWGWAAVVAAGSRRSWLQQNGAAPCLMLGAGLVHNPSLHPPGWLSNLQARATARPTRTRTRTIAQPLITPSPNPWLSSPNPWLFNLQARATARPTRTRTRTMPPTMLRWRKKVGRRLRILSFESAVRTRHPEGRSCSTNPGTHRRFA